METNVFFRWIWRINSILIFLGALGLVGLISYELLRGLFRSPPETPVVTNVAEDPTGIENWVLGRMEEMSGTNFAMIRLVSENNEVLLPKSSYLASGSGYFRSNKGPAKNVLFVDTKNNTSHWLFPDNSQIVSDSEPFPIRSYSKHTKTITKVVFYEVVEKDTNGDGVKNESDKLSLAVSKPSGEDYKVILQQFDRVIGKSLSEEDMVVVI